MAREMLLDGERHKRDGCKNYCHISGLGFMIFYKVYIILRKEGNDTPIISRYFLYYRRNTGARDKRSNIYIIANNISLCVSILIFEEI